ncbi:MAG: acyltransferase [Parvularculaceae bacterium]|nr:acyltransferase [Parvularculaceae bacterium]
MGSFRLLAADVGEHGSERAPAAVARIYHLHAFRAFAIISIVAVHALSFGVNIAPAEVMATPPLIAMNSAVQALFHGGTLYFALISGLLYPIALRAKGVRHFYSAKVGSVVAPYVFMTLLLEAFEWRAGRGLFLVEQSIWSYLAHAAAALVTGSGSFQFWYLPILFGLYLATPLIDRLLKDRSRLPFLILLIVAPLVVTRTGSTVSAQSFVYFLGAYSLGMLIGADYAAAAAAIRKRRGALLLTFFAASAALGGLFAADIDMAGPVSLRESAYYAQKISLGLFVLDLLRGRERQTRWLAPIATHSFPTYFMHVSVIAIAGRTFRAYFGQPDDVLEAFGLGLGLFAAGLGVSMLISMGMKRLLGKWARFLIGS